MDDALRDLRARLTFAIPYALGIVFVAVGALCLIWTRVLGLPTWLYGVGVAALLAAVACVALAVRRMRRFGPL